MKRYITICIFMFLILLSIAISGCRTQYLGGNRDEKWTKDLEYLRKALPRKSVDSFFNISEGEFNDEIDDLEEKICDLNDEEIIDGIYKITASIGDAHTNAYARYNGRFPVQFYYFGNDIYLINTTEKYDQVLNYKLKKINGMEIEHVENLLKPLIPHENEANIKKHLPTFLSRPDILKGVSITDSLDKVDFELEDSNGNEHNIEIEAVNDDNDLNWIVEKNDSSYPLYRQNSDLNYWYKYLEEAKAVYFKYNSCIEDEDIGTIKDMTDEIFNLIDSGKADKLIIDVRNNSGGSDGYLNELIEGIKARNINNPDKLFVIIGRETFSSAIIEAARLDEETNATLVGEMTSGKPNHYGSVGNFKLPNSKISIRYSTKYINIFKNQGNSLMPDVLKEVSIDDYINKKDPALDYILKNS
ncbi:peptidase S41 [Clostridium butyricum]|uniref:S41 family peptidase n=1 Tax=Clostridium butyricum TaxID=1492 RepID=UPI00051C0487|nr:S41 family peptidase [Clostridium butyricum]QUF84817.1 peptidase S41 [Clostridium butyricum]